MMQQQDKKNIKLSKNKITLYIAIDITGSMSDALEGIKMALSENVKYLHLIKVCVVLVLYGDYDSEFQKYYQVVNALLSTSVYFFKKLH